MTPSTRPFCDCELRQRAWNPNTGCCEFCGARFEGGCVALVPPGQRHAMLKRLAGVMRLHGGSRYDEIEAALLAANKARCNPPKADAEIRAIARWAVEQTVAAEQEDCLRGDDSISDGLRRGLRNRTGKLRVSDAYLIGGIEAGKANQDQVARFGLAIRELGWERQRRYFDGVLSYVYVKGNEAEREVELVVEYDPHMRRVRIEVDKAQQTAPTDRRAAWAIVRAYVDQLRQEKAPLTFGVEDAVLGLVLADLRNDAEGIHKHCRGRFHLGDAYREMLEGSADLAAELAEHGVGPATKIIETGSDRLLCWYLYDVQQLCTSQIRAAIQLRTLIKERSERGETQGVAPVP